MNFNNILLLLFSFVFIGCIQQDPIINEIILIENNLIIYSDLNGDITKEYIDSGTTIWKYEYSIFVVSDRLLVDNKICFTTISGVICLDKNTGKQIFEVDDHRVTRTMSLKAHDNNIVIISQNGLLEITSDTGEVIKHVGTNPATLINEDPILYGDDFYILGKEFYGEQGISKYSYKDHSLESSVSFIDDESILFATGRSPVNSKIISLDLNGSVL